MAKKILVAFGSKYGATAGIAEKIGEVLRESGFSVDIKPADAAGDLNGYDAVILGSGVYAGGWLKTAADLLKKQEKVLATLPVWLFSSGPTGKGDPLELVKDWQFPEMLQPIADRINPRGISLFQGAMDLDKLNFAEKLIIKAMKGPLGDFRNWEAITAWAESIAASLK